jgi:hypothetical protein
MNLDPINSENVHRLKFLSFQLLDDLLENLDRLAYFFAEIFDPSILYKSCVEISIKG